MYIYIETWIPGRCLLALIQRVDQVLVVQDISRRIGQHLQDLVLELLDGAPSFGDLQSIGRLSGGGALGDCVFRVCGGGGGCADGGVPLGAGPCCPDVGRCLSGVYNHHRG